MKGLIFNLLDSMARESGCADDAWELVMEFVASEAEYDAPSDTCLSCFERSESLFSMDTPADAMMQCLGNEMAGGFETLSEFPDGASAEADDWISDSIPAMMDPDSCTPQLGMASPEGFSQNLLNLLEQLLAEALTGDPEDGEDEPPLVTNTSRRMSS